MRNVIVCPSTPQVSIYPASPGNFFYKNNEAPISPYNVCLHPGKSGGFHQPIRRRAQIPLKFKGAPLN